MWTCIIILNMKPEPTAAIPKGITNGYNEMVTQMHNFNSSQYGFCVGHSTELAAIEIVDHVIQNLDNNETPINIYLDLSKAFDTLDHSILFQKLKFYGIDGTSLKISNREQFVEFENVY